MNVYRIDLSGVSSGEFERLSAEISRRVFIMERMADTRVLKVFADDVSGLVSRLEIPPESVSLWPDSR